MLTIIFAAALGTEPSALDLNLICPGQYEDTETERGQAHSSDGDEQNSTSITVHRSVMRQGTAKVRFHGDAGELTLPDGQKRVLGNVVADSRSIIADYERRMLLFRYTWRLEVNRLTGEIKISTGSDVGFEGVCSPEPLQPKF